MSRFPSGFRSISLIVPNTSVSTANVKSKPRSDISLSRIHWKHIGKIQWVWLLTFARRFFHRRVRRPMIIFRWSNVSKIGGKNLNKIRWNGACTDNIITNAYLYTKKNQCDRDKFVASLSKTPSFYRHCHSQLKTNCWIAGTISQQRLQDVETTMLSKSACSRCIWQYIPAGFWRTPGQWKKHPDSWQGSLSTNDWNHSHKDW